jgi:hypothetical protein
MTANTSFILRDVAFTVPPQEVAGWIKESIVPGYLLTILASALIYDSSKHAVTLYLTRSVQLDLVHTFEKEVCKFEHIIIVMTLTASLSG